MTTHMMIDIETLSTKPNAAIIAIGACVFNEQQLITAQEWLIDPLQSPGHRDANTWAWWNKQDPEVREAMMAGELEPGEACEELTQFVNSHRPKVVWANSPSFDCIILRHLFDCKDMATPWPFWAERCYRTAMDFAKKAKARIPNRDKSQAHDAKQDAIQQAQRLQAYLQFLSGS